MNLDIQRVSGSTRRNVAYFKQIVEGTQHASVETGLQNLFNLKAGSSKVSKVILFEDVDQTFEGEEDFYSSLRKLIQSSRVPVLMTANSHDAVNENLVKQFFEKREEDDDLAVYKPEVLVGHQLVKIDFQRVHYAQEHVMLTIIGAMFKGLEKDAMY